MTKGFTVTCGNVPKQIISAHYFLSDRTVSAYESDWSDLGSFVMRRNWNETYWRSFQRGKTQEITQSEHTDLLEYHPDASRHWFTLISFHSFPFRCFMSSISLFTEIGNTRFTLYVDTYVTERKINQDIPTAVTRKIMSADPPSFLFASDERLRDKKFNRNLSPSRPNILSNRRKKPREV